MIAPIFNPTFDLGTLLQVGVMIYAAVKFYFGVLNRMSETEKQILAILQRLETIEEKQTAHAETLAGMGAKIDILMDWFRKKVDRRAEA